MKVSVTNLIIALTCAVNAINAVQFKVICAPKDHGGSGVNVNIDGKSFPMQSANNDILFEYEYDGTLSKYYYEIAGVPDKSENLLFNGNPRTWDPKSTTTLYEVYGRPQTLGDDMIETIPRIYEPLKGYEKFSQLFQEGEINVINVHMSDANYNQLIELTQRDEELSITIDFELYTPYEKYHFTNASISLSGQGSMNKGKKPYKIDLSPNDADESNSEIFKRKEFKLRSLYYDQTYIRNKLTSDVAESLALPITQSSYCRLYLNNKSYGLYELSDMYKKKFVKRFFDPEIDSDQKAVIGTLYKAESSLDDCGDNYPAFLYTDTDTELKKLYKEVAEPTAGYDILQDIRKFIKWLEDLPTNASVEQIKEKLELDTLLKNTVLEYMTCHWDGYLSNGNNYLIYYEPRNDKYHLFSYDFDLTFGKYCDSETIKVGDFDTYVNSANTGKKYKCKEGNTHSMIYNKILMNPEVRKLLNNYIKEIAQNLINPKALEKRINYLHQFYKVDMEWDLFCRNEMIETKFFIPLEKGEGDPMTMDMVEREYSGGDEVGRDSLSFFMNEWVVGIANAYGVSIPQSPVTKGKYGTVGGKLMTLGSDDDDKSKKGESSSSGTIVSSNSFMPFIYTLICMILVWMIN